jgi:Peptidase A4 family
LKSLAILSVLVLGALLASSASASAQPRVYHVSSTSTNWAGYATTGSTFTDVKGTWVQPAVDCSTTSTSSYAAFWVGLGGFASDANGGLEQTGTEADCRNGYPSYSAWYEVLPDASIGVPLTVSPGDTITAEVSVAGPVVTLTLADLTSGQTYSTQATPSLLDTSAAEWIAEAPSQCYSASRCTQLPLANFGTVAFSGSSTTANGHVGTISDASWSSTSINLGGTAGSAIPAALSPDGSGFSVTFAAPQTPTATQPTPKPKPKPVPKHRHHRR